MIISNKYFCRRHVQPPFNADTSRKGRRALVAGIGRVGFRRAALRIFPALVFILPSLMPQAFEAAFSQNSSLQEGIAGSSIVSYKSIQSSDRSILKRNGALVWVDRGGRIIGSLCVAGGYGTWLSPDEKQFVASRLDKTTWHYGLWLHDAATGATSRFTSGPGPDITPVWSPDGSRIVWSSNREGIHHIYQKGTGDSAKEELLLKSNYHKYVTDWSKDGRYIIYDELGPRTKGDIWVLPMDGDQKPFPYLQTRSDEAGGRLSPDGRWLAYTEPDESGKRQIYVRSFPSSGNKVQVSPKGGIAPRWRGDGRELYFISGNGRIVALEIKDGESFAAASPRELFYFAADGIPLTGPYTVSADGQRFLINIQVK